MSLRLTWVCSHWYHCKRSFLVLYCQQVHGSMDHGPDSTWYLVTTRIMGINLAPGIRTCHGLQWQYGHEHQYSPQWQLSPQLSTWLQVAAQIIDINHHGLLVIAQASDIDIVQPLFTSVLPTPAACNSCYSGTGNCNVTKYIFCLYNSICKYSMQWITGLAQSLWSL